MIFGSCHFLCHQFTQRDEPEQIIADMDALAAFSAAFIRSPHRLLLSAHEPRKALILSTHPKVVDGFNRQRSALPVFQYLANSVQIRTCANFCTGSLGAHPKPRNRTLCELRVFAKCFYDHRS